MDDIDCQQHIEKIRGWIAEHLEAEIQLVDHHRELDGYLGRADWSAHRDLPLIQIARYITRNDISNSLCALGVRGHVDGCPQLSNHAHEIESTDSPILFLQHLVLHEVAHALHKWPQSFETQCDLWVYHVMTSVHPPP